MVTHFFHSQGLTLIYPYLRLIESHFLHSQQSCAARVLEVKNYFLGFIGKKEIIAQSPPRTFSLKSPGNWSTESPCQQDSIGVG